jgi:uncharacterized protein (DUF2062 family)
MKELKKYWSDVAHVLVVLALIWAVIWNFGTYEGWFR